MKNISPKIKEIVYVKIWHVMFMYKYVVLFVKKNVVLLINSLNIRVFIFGGRSFHILCIVPTNWANSRRQILKYLNKLFSRVSRKQWINTINNLKWMLLNLLDEAVVGRWNSLSLLRSWTSKQTGTLNKHIA